MSRLENGQVAPQFTIDAVGEQGQLQRVSLADLVAVADKGVVVYFYPKAGTPGCTKQACDFRDSLGSLKTAGYTVLGISPDSVAAQQKFAEAQSLNFLLGCDPEHEVMAQWGAWGEKKLYGKTLVGVIRSTFVVDPEGKIVLAQYGVKATGHVARLRRDLGIDQ